VGARLVDNGYVRPSVEILIVIVGITFALIKCFGLGMKWARSVLLILFLLGLAVLPFTYAALLKASILIAVLSLLQTILQILALYYLFSRASTEWFNQVKQKAQDEPQVRSRK
jgi:hypothetical protein